MVRTPHPYCLVEMDFSGHRNKTLAPGITIEIQKHLCENGLNKRIVNCDRGWIKHVPNKKEVAGSPIVVKEGSYVFFHFHTLQPQNEVWVDGSLYYKVHYSNIFLELTEDNEVIPLNRFVFTEILFEKPSSLILLNPTPPKPYTHKSKVAIKPPYVDTVEVGEIVFHMVNTNYDIELPDGRIYYRIRESEVIGQE